MSNAADFVQQVIEEPKSSVGVYEFPCGYIDREGNLHKEFQVREMTGAEEDLLSSKSTQPYQRINALLSACLVRVGSVTDKGQLSVIVQDLTVGDRMYLIFCVRRVTLGDIYPFKAKCPECKHESVYNMSIGELKIKEMTEPLKRLYDTKMPSGKSATFRIPTGKDELKASKIQKGEDVMSQSILMRLETLEGHAPTLNQVKGLGLRDRNYLREQFEEMDGGVNTNAEMSCPACGTEFQEDLDISQSGFFFPGRRKV